jgi:hypothetical protein
VVNIKDGFKVYVQFKPLRLGYPSDDSNNIFVTLELLKWNWEAHSQYSGEWELTGTNYVSPVTAENAYSFPSWIKVHRNNDPFYPCF